MCGKNSDIRGVMWMSLPYVIVVTCIGLIVVSLIIKTFAHQYVKEQEKRKEVNLMIDCVRLNRKSDEINKDKIRRIIIIGAGGVGKGVYHIIEDINKVKETWEIVGFIDENEKLQGVTIIGIPILGTIDILSDPKYAECCFVFAIGDPEVKEKLIEKVIKYFPTLTCPTLIHPTAVISDEAEIGYGAVINALSVIEPVAKIGNYALVYYGCTIGHDSVIEDYSTLLPQCTVSGNVILRKGCNIGSNSTIIQGVEIGEQTIVGAGAVVTKSLPANCTAVGVPARAIKFRSRVEC